MAILAPTSFHPQFSVYARLLPILFSARASPHPLVLTLLTRCLNLGLAFVAF
jgi:hypothetical protein